MPETTRELIARIRRSTDAEDVLTLCDRAEGLLDASGRLERALHDAMKIIEKKD